MWFQPICDVFIEGRIKPYSLRPVLHIVESLFVERLGESFLDLQLNTRTTAGLVIDISGLFGAMKMHTHPSATAGDSERQFLAPCFRDGRPSKYGRHQIMTLSTVLAFIAMKSLIVNLQMANQVDEYAEHFKVLFEESYLHAIFFLLPQAASQRSF
jgi:hypothetical protein